MPPAPTLLPLTAAWLPTALLVAGALWLLLSILMQAGALRANALARHAAPAAFHTPPRAAPGAAQVHLAFLGDLQRGVLDAARPIARLLRDDDVDLLVSSGDFVSHGEAPYYGVTLAAFARAGLDRPVRVVPGNHDLWPRRSKDDRIGGALFTERFGARCWALHVGPTLVVGLDTGADLLLPEQLPWLERVLTEHAGVPWILVCHRPVHNFDIEGTPVRGDLAALVPLLQARPPTLVVSGHLHRYLDTTVDGIRHIVNAHGGDVHGFGLRREPFEILHVTATGSETTVELRRHGRKLDLRTALDQLAVRFWSDRRTPWGALLAWPAGLLLRLVGRHVPVIRYPVERRVPDPETLVARRRERAPAP